MNWKVLLITIGIFAAIAAFIWLCRVYSVVTCLFIGICALGLVTAFCSVYIIIASILEE